VRRAQIVILSAAKRADNPPHLGFIVSPIDPGGTPLATPFFVQRPGQTLTISMKKNDAIANKQESKGSKA
jgi:hypothetical protein